MFDKPIKIIQPTLCAPEEIAEEMKRIFSSGEITSAGYVAAFERACAGYLGVEHAVAVSSATSALMLAVKGLKLTGEVIVPSFTFTATVHALVWNGLTPVFVDCEEGSYNIDVQKIQEKITPNTSAIMPVYIYGSPPDIEGLEIVSRTNGLKLVFDSAQGFGAEYQGVRAGRFGNCEIFSLSPTKVLTAVEGGLLTTNDDALARYVREARDYGKKGDDIEHVGLSSRMSEVNAVIGLANMRNVDRCIENRRQLIETYQACLDDLDGISFQKVPLWNKSSGNYMVIFVDPDRFGMTRDDLNRALGSENIQTKKYFYPAVHQQKAYFPMNIMYEGKLPVTERAARRALALPLYGHMKKDMVEQVCRAIHRICTWHAKRISELSPGT